LTKGERVEEVASGMGFMKCMALPEGAWRDAVAADVEDVGNDVGVIRRWTKERVVTAEH